MPEERGTPDLNERLLNVPITLGPNLKSGTQIVCGFLPAGALIPNRYKIPYRDSLKRTGYQRPPSQTRINELASDLQQGRVDLPTAVLLNIRDKNIRSAIIKDPLIGHRLDLARLWLPNQSGDTNFYVVDGQHRILALEKLIKEEPNQVDKWKSFTIPFVCMLGADENEEMDQFYIVNSKAKSVKTDLAFALLKERSDRNPEIYEALIERGREWQVDGQTLVERLAEVSPVWNQRIRFPAMDKDTTTITNTSFVSSLKSLLTDSPIFKRSNLEQRIKVLDAYWQGIRLSMRAAFDDPTKYSIQKGIGVIVMHDILPDVIELIRTNGGSIVDPEAYQKILEPALEGLEGDDGLGQLVKGIDFWKASVEGAAGSFSSGAGRRVLAAKLRQLLPKIEIE